MVKTHTRPQVMYQLDIGSGYYNFCTNHPFVKELALEVSKVVGGCTLIDSVGYWADVERADKEDYSDVAVGDERNVQLQVKAELSKEIRLEETIVNTVVRLAKQYPMLYIDWVCGHKVQSDGTVTSFNFSVNENK